jgi:hypothetical protein
VLASEEINWANSPFVGGGFDLESCGINEAIAATNSSLASLAISIFAVMAPFLSLGTGDRA